MVPCVPAVTMVLCELTASMAIGVGTVFMLNYIDCYVMTYQKLGVKVLDSNIRVYEFLTSMHASPTYTD